MNSNAKTLTKYVVPSVAAMMVNFLYVVVDGIFVGRGVGTNALAAVNISIPYTSFVIALASMLVMGGASVTAIRMGRGDDKGANDAFMTSAVLVAGTAAILTLIGVFLPGPVAALSGASDALMQNTIDYIRYYCLFAVVNGLAMLCTTFVRNDGRPGLAFAGMVSGALANIFLDWLFVFPLQMGIKGAAIASGLGQLLSLAILSTHFLHKKGALRVRRFSFTFALARKVLWRGMPDLITQMGTPITTLCYNYVVISALGEIGVAAYSVIGYLLTLILGVFLGVSQGIQPLIGNCFGAGDTAGERYYLKAGLALNLGLSALIYAGLFIFGPQVISVFNGDAELGRIAYEAIRIYGLSFVVASVNIIFTTYYFSTKRSGHAIAIAALRGLCLNILFILTFPSLFGAGALWWAVVAAEIGTAAVGITFLLRGGARRPQKALAKATGHKV
ncbi:MATE family efflux transporter [Clostridia bacterium OttesenSCG-928-O13]|nr:MATE family efflux transporter [Clostridia bacterium OttesenSCG-928-O13]